MLRKTLCSLFAIVGLLAMTGAANAAEPAGVTITSCKNDALTLAGKVSLSGTSARKARGAVLQMQFKALGLFGLPKTGALKVIGKKTSASSQDVFTGLVAGNWVGVLSWRFKKGSKTVLSGDTRSQALRIGSAKGQANCTLSEGLKPSDTTPPQLSIVPDDALWHRASTLVQLSATDDFSGVQSMRYSLDGGPITAIPNRGTFEIAAEGAHTVSWAATDVSGNTGSRTATVRVDAAPPTKPVVQGPASVTANRTPTIQWAASTDSGSGMRGYVVTIQRADGSVAATLNADANTTSVTAPALDDGQNYTATVTAVDNTTGQPWATNSDPYGFRVDTTANVESVTPPAGSVLAGAAKDTTFTLTLDRAADPGTVSAGVKLDRNDESGADPSATIGCANTPCTRITVDPDSTLPEGRYAVVVTGALKSGNGENTPFAAFSAPYAVPFLEDANGVDPPGGPCLGNTPIDSTPTSLKANSAEPATLDFDWSTSGSGPGWTVQALIDGATSGNPVAGGPGNGHAQLTFTIPQGQHNVAFRFTTTCSSNNSLKLDTNNLVATRSP